MREKSIRIGWRSAAAMQAGFAAAALAALAFVPPAHGRTLLIPLNGEPISDRTLDRVMLTRIAAGPIPGSVVVDGRGRSLSGALFDRGIIMLAAPAALCGGREPSGGSAS